MKQSFDDVDPKRLDLQPKRRGRRRKRRNRPDPPAALKAGEADAIARASKRPLSPGAMLEPLGDGPEGWEITSPHSDLDLWETQLGDLFGTRSFAAMKVFVRDLKRLARLVWDERAQQWKASERELNAALAMVADIKPRNTAEAALAAQMVAVHWMQMRLSQEALGNGTIDGKTALVAASMARTYSLLLERYHALRNRKKPVRQTIIVKRENHVHYHDQRGGGVSRDSEQPETTDGGTLVAQECAALPSPEEAGRVVPITDRARKARV